MDKKKAKALPAPKSSRYLDDMDDDDIPPKKKRDEDEPRKKKVPKVIDVTGKKKKKKPKDDEVDGHALALLDENGKKLSLTKTKVLLKTQFGRNAEQVLRLLETDDIDSAVLVLYKRMLQSVVDILPLAELGIRKTKGVRGIHGYTMVMSQLRELMVDIQAAQDRGMMGEMLVQQVLQPVFTDMAQDTVMEFATIASDAKMLMGADEYKIFREKLLESRGRLANRMNKGYADMKEGTIGYLQR